jgi:NAD(P)-dependent dehydrogenase (short-subunit alcohol dehydrogenase family)
MLVKDRAVLVTGGAQGIGRAIAACFVREGARVMLADVNVMRAEQTAAELRMSGGRVAAFGIDLARVADISGLVNHTVRELGGLDVLVNNAGVEFGEPFFEVTQDTWDTHLNVNLRAMFFTTQAGALWMKDHGGGAVVNIASVQGAIFSPRYIPYTVSKSGVRGLTSVLAVALAPHGIRVNAVAPGWCNTAMNKVAADSTLVQERLKLIPLHRVGEPEEMAEAVLFLASPRAGYVTGQTFTIDGGWTLGAPPSSRTGSQ